MTSSINKMKAMVIQKNLENLKLKIIVWEEQELSFRKD